MKKLKFAKDNGTEFYKEFRVRVAHYFYETGKSREGGNIMLVKIGLYFSLDLLLFGLMITSTSLTAFYVFYVLMGVAVLLTAFNISHDAAHGVAVKSKRGNKLLFQLSFNLLGNNAYVWGKHHTESHHLYTNVEGSDIDVLNNPLLRMTDAQPLRPVHRYQYLYAPVLYLFYTLNWFCFREVLMLFNISSRTIKVVMPPIEIFKLVLFKLLYIGYMIVLPICLLPFGWASVLMAFLLMHFVVSLLFVSVLSVAHLSDYVAHPVPDADGKLDMSWATLQLCTSVDYNASSRWLNWTIGGFNAHAVHHLLPDVSHVHYPDLLPLFMEMAAKYGLTYVEMPYGKTLAAHFRFLKAMGNTPHPQIVRFEKQAPSLSQRYRTT